MKSIDHNFDISKELGLEDLPNEVWKDIPDYEGLYQVSNLGRVKSLERMMINPSPYGKTPLRKHKAQIRKIRVDRHGYCCVSIYIEGKAKNIKVHRLVASAFIPNPENKREIDHINGIKTDNRVSNLRWVTSSENSHNPLTYINRTVKGRKRETFCRRKVLNISTGKQFNSIREAAAFYKLHARFLGQNIKNHHIYGGYEWAFI